MGRRSVSIPLPLRRPVHKRTKTLTRSVVGYSGAGRWIQGPGYAGLAATMARYERLTWRFGHAEARGRHLLPLETASSLLRNSRDDRSHGKDGSLRRRVPSPEWPAIGENLTSSSRARTVWLTSSTPTLQCRPIHRERGTAMSRAAGMQQFPGLKCSDNRTSPPFRFGAKNRQMDAVGPVCWSNPLAFARSRLQSGGQREGVPGAECCRVRILSRNGTWPTQRQELDLGTTTPPSEAVLTHGWHKAIGTLDRQCLH
ncbi:hypothetical protein R1flu_011323 [Riccia fluitans]|uniref:Uncharacterized protein n=1 Tax=Riccia fluitans TaxID=41844 RepID=A0ABD1Z7G9_9MARC